MTDDMLRAVGKKRRGWFRVNFYNAFIDEDYRKSGGKAQRQRQGCGSKGFSTIR